MKTNFNLVKENAMKEVLEDSCSHDCLQCEDCLTIPDYDDEGTGESVTRIYCMKLGW